MLDSQRYLSPEDQQYLKVTRMDPRIEWMPDPLVRLNATKAMSMGLVNLTERFAKGRFGGSFFFSRSNATSLY